MDQLEEFRARVKARLEERANASVNLMGSVRFRAPQVAVPNGTQTPVALPSFSIEEIALAHTLYQAESQVLVEMMGAVDEEYRRVMGQPVEANNPDKTASIEKQTTERKKKGAY